MTHHTTDNRYFLDIAAAFIRGTSLRTTARSFRTDWLSAAKRKAQEFLRKKQPFVWNAMNLSTHVRHPLIRLFTSYKTRVKILYLETPWTTLLKRNRNRTDPVNEFAIDEMLSKLETPSITEAHQLKIIAT